MKSFKCLRNTTTNRKVICEEINSLNAELNPICHLLALLGGATIVVVSRLRVNERFKLRECLLILRSDYFKFPFLPYKPVGLQGTLICTNIKLSISYLSTRFCTEYHREHSQEDPLSDQLQHLLSSFDPYSY
jgi:hypothetical protein